MEKYPHPSWRLILLNSGEAGGGGDLTRRLDARLIELSMTDNRGLNADEISFSLSDADGQLAIPARGAEVRLYLGYNGTLIDKGCFTIDEVEHAGAPDVLSVRGKSADFLGSADEKKERSWHGQKIGQIIESIAGEHALKAIVSGGLAKTAVAHIDQTDESDASFLTRLAANHDAIATVKDGKLLFYRIGTGKTFSGLSLERVFLSRAAGDSHRFSIADREAASHVRACWYDPKSHIKDAVEVEVKLMKAGKKPKASRANPREGADKTLTLRHACRDRQDALCRAKAAADRIARGVASFSLTLALGRPDLIPELPVTVSGWKPEIDGEDWLIAKASHKLSNSGLVTELELELALDGADGAAEDGGES